MNDRSRPREGKRFGEPREGHGGPSGGDIPPDSRGDESLQRGGGVEKAVGQKSRSGFAAKAVEQKQPCEVTRATGGMSAWEESKHEQADLVAIHSCD